MSTHSFSSTETSNLTMTLRSHGHCGVEMTFLIITIFIKHGPRSAWGENVVQPCLYGLADLLGDTGDFQMSSEVSTRTMHSQRVRKYVNNNSAIPTMTWKCQHSLHNVKNTRQYSTYNTDDDLLLIWRCFDSASSMTCSFYVISFLSP